MPCQFLGPGRRDRQRSCGSRRVRARREASPRRIRRPSHGRLPRPRPSDWNRRARRAPPWSARLANHPAAGETTPVPAPPQVPRKPGPTRGAKARRQSPRRRVDIPGVRPSGVTLAQDCATSAPAPGRRPTDAPGPRASASRPAAIQRTAKSSASSSTPDAGLRVAPPPRPRIAAYPRQRSQRDRAITRFG